jgi:hypothetical protein
MKDFSMTLDANQPADIKPLPAWASVLVILLCLGGGGWMIHWYAWTDSISHEATILDQNAVTPRQAARPARNRPAPVDQPAVRQQDQNTWWVHSPEAAMLISQPSGNPPVITAINYVNYDFVPQENKNRIIYARRIVADSAMSSALKIAPEQLAKMKKLTSQIRMVTESADQDELKALWVEYQASTDKPAVSTKLVQALSALAKKSVDRTRQAAADRAEKIKAVLTDDQWKQFEGMGH